MYQILTDQDVRNFGSMKVAVEAIENAFREQSNGTLVSPPRFHLGTDHGDLVFTVGAATAFQKVIGFRVYDTYGNDLDGHEQLVCVFNGDTGVFKGMIIGNLLGSIRTGAIGGAAINAMARKDADHIAVIGTGAQARRQLEAAVTVRDVRRIKVYSRHQDNRETFAKDMAEQLGMAVTSVNSSRECIYDADIIICATNSDTPVFEMDELKPGVHINSVGPKSIHRHEVPVELGSASSVIATDSIEQLRAYSTPHFLMGTPDESRIVQLSDIVAGRTSGRTTESDITLFCSVGLAGTEVILASEIMKRVQSPSIDF